MSESETAGVLSHESAGDSGTEACRRDPGRLWQRVEGGRMSSERPDLTTTRSVMADGYDPPFVIPLGPGEVPLALDGRDAGTPDEWVARHSDLIRLTGRHPFNSESPLPRLLRYGFITPSSLHYVRNHGHVPRGEWDTWRIEIRGGAVSSPTFLTMDDIATKFPPRTLPVTLVCAGNRRKEANMVKQTIGFNWGAAGLSTAVWKGARLRDVLNCCGADLSTEGAAGRHVRFEGAELLPEDGGTTYGTSLKFHVAIDEASDVLLAYEMNGEKLPPDHGYPLRLIVPGHIGGRMVKWLRRVEVSEKESSNYYHLHDNKVLPTHVDAGRAKSEGEWLRA
ncbi:hypothetical protein CBR_g36817 [Chara braunii]|uniref:Oxidoreductase molybdopterin-binding domain-containing protein n=1 Tax=Chara braunii TaxID=69332 RepID=A0A388LLU3_CHABU|nr:hypothetical protein CBR_g36817 [Chara braunii]|eukprot:GBG83203.1 hypothetical protein CBR_g36817 [Chara braunii]